MKIIIGINGNVYNLPVQQPIPPLHHQQLLYPQQRVFHMQNSAPTALPPVLTNGALNGHSVPLASYYMAGNTTAQPNYYTPPVALNNYSSSLVAQQTQPSMVIQPQLPQRPTDTTFVPTKNLVQIKRVLHSEAYVKYVLYKFV